MATWPDIKAPSRAPWEIVDPWNQDTYLDGGDTARPQFSAPREGTRALSWPAMSLADLAALKTFYLAQGSAAFDWTDPVTGEVAPYRFEPGGLKADPLAGLPGHAQVTAKIKRLGVLS